MEGFINVTFLLLGLLCYVDSQGKRFFRRNASTKEHKIQLTNEPVDKEIKNCLHDEECDNCYESQTKTFHYTNETTGSQAQIKMCCSGCGHKQRKERDPHLDQFCRCSNRNSSPKFLYIVECLYDYNCEECADNRKIDFDDGRDLEITACCPKCSKYIGTRIDDDGVPHCYCSIPDGIHGDCWKGIQCKQCPGTQGTIDKVPVCCSGCKNIKVEINQEKRSPSCNCFRLVSQAEIPSLELSSF